MMKKDYAPPPAAAAAAAAALNLGLELFFGEDLLGDGDRLLKLEEARRAVLHHAGHNLVPEKLLIKKRATHKIETPQVASPFFFFFFFFFFVFCGATFQGSVGVRPRVGKHALCAT